MHGGRTQCTLRCRLSRDSDGASVLIGQLSESSFRMREVNDYGEAVVKPVRFLSADGFNKATMSVEVELDISNGSYEMIVEAKFPERLQGSWHPIGGF